MMSVIVNISLLGFVPFEKTTFESFFKLAGRRDTAYKIVDDPALAKVFLVNGDSPPAIQWIADHLKPFQKALFVGNPDVSGQWPAAPRPIRLTTVLGLLDVISMVPASVPVVDANPEATNQPIATVPVRDEIAAATTSAASAVADFKTAATPPPAAPKSTRRAAVTSGYGSRRNASSDFGVSNFIGLTKSAEQNPKPPQYDEILVVDDSDVALKFMQSRLTRYGFKARPARSGEEALTRVAAEKYKFVFMDVMMDGLDGYQTCRAIKQKKYPSGKAPIVVMLTSRGGSIDKIRGGLAGCDAYLTKPLNEAELLKVLSKFDEQVERSFQATFVGASGMSSRHPM